MKDFDYKAIEEMMLSAAAGRDVVLFASQSFASRGDLFPLRTYEQLMSAAFRVETEAVTLMHGGCEYGGCVRCAQEHQGRLYRVVAYQVRERKAVD